MKIAKCAFTPSWQDCASNSLACLYSSLTPKPGITLMEESINQRVINSLHQELLSGDKQVFRKHYESYRSAYINFARRYTSDEDLIADSYQDSFIALYENIVERKVTELNSSVKTYVFSIAKYSLFSSLVRRLPENTYAVLLPSLFDRCYHA